MANITKIQVGEETYNISDPINTSAIEKSITWIFKPLKSLAKL